VRAAPAGTARARVASSATATGRSAAVPVRREGFSGETIIARVLYRTQIMDL
jgi:hypothetical protein